MSLKDTDGDFSQTILNKLCNGFNIFRADLTIFHDIFEGLNRPFISLNDISWIFLWNCKRFSYRNNNFYDVLSVFNTFKRVFVILLQRFVVFFNILFLIAKKIYIFLFAGFVQFKTNLSINCWHICPLPHKTKLCEQFSNLMEQKLKYLPFSSKKLFYSYFSFNENDD